jgi:hypothetical protein
LADADSKPPPDAKVKPKRTSHPAITAPGMEIIRGSLLSG